MSVEAEPVGRLSWRDFAVTSLLALAVALGGAARMVPGVVGVFHDDAVYAITAKALAEGEGYRLANVPGAPPQTKYPILYPAILAITWLGASALPFESRLAALQIVTLALAALAVAAAYLYCIRFRVAARSAAFAGCILAASAPNVLFYGSQALSEMPFALLVVAALWMGELRLRGGADDARGGLWAGAIVGLPFLCRTVGVAIPVVVVGILAFHRRPVRWVAAGALAVMLPWLAWMLVAGTAADAVTTYHTDYLGWWWSNESLRLFGKNLIKAFVAFSHISLEALAYALYERVGATRSILIVLGTLPWVVVAMRSRRVGLLPVALLGYLAVVCLWPWPPDRFLVPILPLLATLLFEQARRLLTRVLTEHVAIIVIMFVALIAAGTNWRLLERYRVVSKSSHYPYFLLPDEPVQWASYQRAFEWLQSRAEPEDVIAAGFDTMTALYTGRPAIRPFVVRPAALYYDEEENALGTAAEVDEILAAHRLSFLFVSPMPSFKEENQFYELIEAFHRARPGRLRLAYQDPDPRFMIFEVVAATAER